MKAQVRLNSYENYVVDPPEGETIENLIDYVLARIKKACKFHGYKEHGFMQIWNDQGVKVIDCKIQYIDELDKCIMVNNTHSDENPFEHRIRAEMEGYEHLIN